MIIISFPSPTFYDHSSSLWLVFVAFFDTYDLNDEYKRYANKSGDTATQQLLEKKKRKSKKKKKKIRRRPLIWREHANTKLRDNWTTSI